MNNDNKFFEDMSKMAGSMFSNAMNAKNEFSHFIQEHIKMSIKQMDFITRDDYEALKFQVDKLQKEVSSLKKKLATPAKKTAASTAKSKSKK